MYTAHNKINKVQAQIAPQIKRLQVKLRNKK